MVYVKYLPVGVDTGELTDFMKPAGQVISARIITSKTKTYYNSAVVEYNTASSAELATQLLKFSKLRGSAISIYKHTFNSSSSDTTMDQKDVTTKKKVKHKIESLEQFMAYCGW